MGDGFPQNQPKEAMTGTGHRVQDDIQDCTGALGKEGVDRPASGLEQPLSQHLNEQAAAEQAADIHIAGAALDGLRHGGLDGVVGPGAQDAEGHEQRHHNGSQKDSVSGGDVGMVPVSLTQGLTEQAVHTHRHADGAADEQVLHRKGQRQRRYGTLRNLGHIHAVHHIVNRLHQHGQNQGQSHGKQQPSCRAGTHLVLVRLPFIFLFFHDSP